MTDLTFKSPHEASSCNTAVFDDGTSCEPLVPLVVDVDGTLIRGDLLHESALQFIANHPWQIWRLIIWLWAGKVELKRNLAAYGISAAKSVPLREEVLKLIKDEMGRGRSIVLASASERSLVEVISQRVGGIDRIFATGSSVNLAGEAKAAHLIGAYGEKGFDYLADAQIDFAVWYKARGVLALTHSDSFERRLIATFPEAKVVARSRPRIKEYVRAMRPHQWAKNSLVFLPLVAGHYFLPLNFIAAMIAFCCFSMAASSAYILNDLLDLPGDRDHPRKKKRPFAAGLIPVLDGVVLSTGLALIAVALAATVSMRFLEVLLLYFFSTIVYSLYLKRKMIIDVVLLGGLYTLRVLGGVAALNASASAWLLMFSLFLFLSLAIVKRCSELIALKESGKGAPVGRGYREGDLKVLFPFGASAAYVSVLVVAMYLSSPEIVRLYTHPLRLWLACPLLIYWISRVFVICSRGELHDDPVVFALTDRVSWMVAGCVFIVVVVSL